MVNEYAIVEVLEGRIAGESIRVAEWALLDGTTLPAAGGTTRLALERFSDNPQLEGVFLADDLGGGDGALYYAVP